MKQFLAKLKQKHKFKRNHVFVAKGSYIAPTVEIGAFTRINQASHITDCEIGRYCAIGGRLIVRSTDHFTNYLNIQSCAQREIIGSDIAVAGKSKGRVRIGNAVWIGDSVIILPGVTIGDGAVIGAGSVVTKSIPPYTVWAGNPAKQIKSRFEPDIVELLLSLEWWLWAPQKIRLNRALFETDLSQIQASELKDLLERFNE